MHRLITAQLRRLVRQRAFYVCLVLAAALGIGISMLYHYFWTQRGANIAMSYRMMEFYGMDTTVLDEALSVVPKLDIWSFINAFFSDEVKWILSSICVCSLITAEYSSGTVKNSIARGFSRGAIYFSRFIVALAQVFGVHINEEGAPIVVQQHRTHLDSRLGVIEPSSICMDVVKPNRLVDDHGEFLSEFTEVVDSCVGSSCVVVHGNTSYNLIRTTL